VYITANPRRALALAAATAAALAFGLLQLAPAPARTNPLVHPGSSIRDNQPVPPHVAALLNRACANCHSNETRWPWYSAVAPASWLVRDDVHRARTAMNFSEWRRPNEPWPSMAVARLAAVCAAAQQDIMPPRSYRLLHPEARLSAEEKRALCDWTNAGMLALISRHGNARSARPN